MELQCSRKNISRKFPKYWISVFFIDRELCKRFQLIEISTFQKTDCSKEGEKKRHCLRQFEQSAIWFISLSFMSHECAGPLIADWSFNSRLLPLKRLEEAAKDDLNCYLCWSFIKIGLIVYQIAIKY